MPSVQNNSTARAAYPAVAAQANQNASIVSLPSFGQVVDSIDRFFHGEPLPPRDASLGPVPQRAWQVSPRTRRALKCGLMLGGAAAVCYGAHLLTTHKQAQAAVEIRASHTDWAAQAATIYANCYTGNNGSSASFTGNNCAQIQTRPVGEQPCDWKQIWFWEDNIPAACTQQMVGQMQQDAIVTAQHAARKNYALLTLLMLVPTGGMLLGSAAVGLARHAHNLALPDTQDFDIV